MAFPEIKLFAKAEIESITTEKIVLKSGENNFPLSDFEIVVNKAGVYPEECDWIISNDIDVILVQNRTDKVLTGLTPKQSGSSVALTIKSGAKYFVRYGSTNKFYNDIFSEIKSIPQIDTAKYDKQFAAMQAYLDVYNRARPFSGYFYDHFDGSNNSSDAQIDLTKAYLTNAVSAGTNSVNVDSTEGFEQGSEFTLYEPDGTKQERIIVQNINSNDVTFTTNLVNGYSKDACIARSLTDINDSLTMGSTLKAPKDEYISGNPPNSTYNYFAIPSPDGKYFAIPKTTSDFGVWEWKNNQPERISCLYPISGNTCKLASFSADGRFLFFTSGSWWGVSKKTGSGFTQNIAQNKYNCETFAHSDNGEKFFTYKNNYINGYTFSEQTQEFIQDPGSANVGQVFSLSTYRDKYLIIVKDTEFIVADYNRNTINTTQHNASGIGNINYGYQILITNSDFLLLPTNSGIKVYKLTDKGSDVSISELYTIAEYKSGFQFNKANNGIVVTPSNASPVFIRLYDSKYSIKSLKSTVLTDQLRQLATDPELTYGVSALKKNPFAQWHKFKSPTLKVDVRYNISSPSDIKQVACWIENTKKTGFKVDIACSINTPGTPETFVDINETITELKNGIEETAGSFTSLTASTEATIRLTLTRTSTSDNVNVKQILGAVD